MVLQAKMVHLKLGLEKVEEKEKIEKVEGRSIQFNVTGFPLNHSFLTYHENQA
jgi:hypothetical protein